MSVSCSVGRVSRLARNNTDWYRLLDLCGVTDTLIGDADGIYHPALFNVCSTKFAGRIIGAAQRFKNVDPRVFPFEVRPIPAAVAAPMLGRLDRLRCLLRAAGRQEAPRDFRSDLWHLSGFFLVFAR
jgi:hypothetical protein